MARIFASMIPETLIEAKIPVLKETSPEYLVQNSSDHAKSQNVKPNILEYFRCLAVILEKNEDG